MNKYISYPLFVLMLSGCGTEDYVERLIPGPSGEPGIPGEVGPAGADGQDCSVTAVVPGGPAPNGGALITCGSSSVLITNGLNGEDGEDGEDGLDAPIPPYSIVELINPCGDASGVHDEILIRLNATTIFASFSQNAAGNNTRLSLLTPGSYQTTDGTNCNFTVTAGYSVTW